MKKNLCFFLLISLSVLQSMGQTAEQFFEDGVKQSEARNYKKALEYFDRSIDLSKGQTPKVDYLYYWKGLMHLRLNDFDCNELMLRLSESNNTRSHMAFSQYVLASLNANCGDHNQAIKYLDKSISLGYKDDSLCFRDEFRSVRNESWFVDVCLSNNFHFSSNKDLVKVIVEQKINKWQQKGLFEKTDDFIRRVSEENRKEKINEITQFVIDSLALNSLDLAIKQIDYDADNETFKIIYESLQPIFVPVPIDQAPDFYHNRDRMVFRNYKFTIQDNEYAVLKLEIFDPVKQNSYFYDSYMETAFYYSNLNFNFDPVQIDDINMLNAPSARTTDTRNVSVGRSDVATDIPQNSVSQTKTFVLIIGNEDYTRFQNQLSSEVNVEFARNDARTFAEYARKTFGVPDENIIVLYDAIGSLMRREIQRVVRMAEVVGGEIIFFYAGHGFPDPVTREGYMMPVDVSGSNYQEGIKLSWLYDLLGSERISKATVVLDACFSGGGRNQGLLAARGVRVRPRQSQYKGNLVVFSATSEDQVSLPYKEKQHGIFTYHFLEALKNSQGKISYQELSKYLQDIVQLNSLRINYTQQIPEVNVSPEVENVWEGWRFVEAD